MRDNQRSHVYRHNLSPGTKKKNFISEMRGKYKTYSLGLMHQTALTVSLARHHIILRSMLV